MMNVDPRPGRYFVSVIDPDAPGRRGALLLGPFSTHQEALDQVDAVRVLAERQDPRAAWYAFGTARLHDGAPDRLGILNRLWPDPLVLAPPGAPEPAPGSAQAAPQDQAPPRGPGPRRRARRARGGIAKP